MHGIPKKKTKSLIKEFNKEANISLALLVASSALLNKKTWQGDDYATHWLWVGGVGQEYLGDEEKIVGILHDVVEDSDWEIEDLEEIGFSKRISEGVESVTKIEGEKYLDATKRCSRNQLGRVVKKRDNRHNMDLTRSLSQATPKQLFLYPISYSYLNAVDKGEIAPDSSIWAFLQKPKYESLLTLQNFHTVAAATSELPPPFLKEQLKRKMSNKTGALYLAHTAFP